MPYGTGMPRLILLNGPPGCGKSTLARRYVEDHPLALNLDIDQVRGLLGRWPTNPEQAGLLARELALAMARTHLRAGHDVVIPQYLGRLPFLHQLDQLAAATGVPLREFVLLDTRENSLRRWTDRETLIPAPAAEATDATQVAAMYDRLLALIPHRPDAVVIRTDGGKIDAAYRDLLNLLQPARPSD